MKQKYLDLEIEIIEFDMEDIITTSNNIQWPDPNGNNVGGDTSNP